MCSPFFETFRGTITSASLITLEYNPENETKKKEIIYICNKNDIKFFFQLTSHFFYMSWGNKIDKLVIKAFFFKKKKDN